MADGLLGDLGEVIKTAVLNRCTFENDTKYKVVIVDHDGTRILEPGRSQGIVWYIICFSLGNTILDKKTNSYVKKNNTFFHSGHLSVKYYSNIID